MGIYNFRGKRPLGGIDTSPQEAYRRRVATEHRQKRAFWERMSGGPAVAEDDPPSLTDSSRNEAAAITTSPLQAHSD